MKRESDSSRGLAPIVVGAALSALAMYMLDPDRGRRRRALVRDKVRSAVTGSTDWLDMAVRDISSRAQGLRAMALRPFRRKGVPDDLALIERVRARMGRVVSHPHALQIGARSGRVVLSGPILASEADAFLDAVRSIEGVSEVEDHLVIYERPDSIPSLQGGVPRPGMRAELVRENWSPSLRFAAMVGGGLLALYGMRQRTATRFVLAGVGLGLAARGAANVPLSRVPGAARGRRGIEMEKTIHIDAPPDVVYDMWIDCANFPHFMSHVKEVTDFGDGRSRWVVNGLAGADLEWNVAVTRAVRPQLMAWQTEPGSLVQHAGAVRFEPDSGGTRVSVKMIYDGAGGVGHLLASMLGGDPGQQMDDDLSRMKIFIERGVPPHNAARPEASQPTTSPLH
jgi:uncharacterized membrane protein